MSFIKPPAFLVPEFEEENSDEETMQSSPKTTGEVSQNMPSPCKALDVKNLKTTAEQLLYNAWRESELKLKKAEDTNAELRKHLEQMQLRLSSLEEKCQKSSNNIVSEHENIYNTDDEELNKETEWIVKKVGQKNAKQVHLYHHLRH